MKHSRRPPRITVGTIVASKRGTRFHPQLDVQQGERGVVLRVQAHSHATTWGTEQFQVITIYLTRRKLVLISVPAVEWAILHRPPISVSQAMEACLMIGMDDDAVRMALDDFRKR